MADPDLLRVRESIVEHLHGAARDRRHPMHVPVVATADGDVRMMVLRAFDVGKLRLCFHTDARAPKVDAIARDPTIGILGYDPGQRIQIRLRGAGVVEAEGPHVDAAWQAADSFARRCYLGAAPGEETAQASSGLPDWVEGRRPTEEELRPARANFALLTVIIAAVEWYALSHEGHRRAIFRRAGAGLDEGRWITP